MEKARAQLEQVKLEELNLKSMKSTENQSTTYVLIQSFIKQLTLFVKQCSFHTCNKSDQLQLRPEHHYTPIFALPWQCDIMEYSSIRVPTPLERKSTEKRIPCTYRDCLERKETRRLENGSF